MLFCCIRNSSSFDCRKIKQKKLPKSTFFFFALLFHLIFGRVMPIEMRFENSITKTRKFTSSSAIVIRRRLKQNEDWIGKVVREVATPTKREAPETTREENTKNRTERTKRRKRRNCAKQRYELNRSIWKSVVSFVIPRKREALIKAKLAIRMHTCAHAFYIHETSILRPFDAAVNVVFTLRPSTTANTVHLGDES